MNYRPCVATGLVGGLCLLAGCGNLPTLTPNKSDPNSYFSETVRGFGQESLYTKAEATTSRAVTVQLAEDLLQSAPFNATVELGDVNLATWSDDGAKMGPTLPDSSTSHHVEVLLRLAEQGRGACATGLPLGSFALTPSDDGAPGFRHALPLGPSARELVSQGRFEVCAEVHANFDGAVSVGQLSFSFGSLAEGDDQVVICHVPPDHPEQRHTITVGASAVPDHMSHGDSLGECTDNETPADTDQDGVPDDQDACPDTPLGDEVYDNGCTVIVLEVDAGANLSVTAGDSVSITGTAQVVQGDYDPAGLVFVWEQLRGTLVVNEGTGATLTFSTEGMVADLLFRLTASTDDGRASASDEVNVTVLAPYAVHLSSGKWHNVALLNNGEVRLWGWNRDGQLGDGSFTGDVVSADAGPRHTLLATADGTAWTFGLNALTSSATPMVVPGLDDVVQVAALAEGGLLLRADGTVWGFADGENSFCELAGEPYPGNAGVLGPVDIPGLPGNIVSIAAGNYHGAALDADGTVWVWGSRFGCTPQAVLDNVARVEAGDVDFFLFVRNDGTAWGLGFNFHGQLGNGTTFSNYHVPTQVQGLTDVAATAAGDRHSLFLQSDRTLWAAGWNRYCQLGLESEVQPAEFTFGDYVAVPTQLAQGDFALIAGGQMYSIAAKNDHTLWGWGQNNVGQLSGGTASDLPFSVCTPTRIAFEGDVQ